MVRGSVGEALSDVLADTTALDMAARAVTVAKPMLQYVIQLVSSAAKEAIYHSIDAATVTLCEHTKDIAQECAAFVCDGASHLAPSAGLGLNGWSVGSVESGVEYQAKGDHHESTSTKLLHHSSPS